MTRKLYDEDARLLEFDGTVVSCIYDEKRKCYDVILDQTAFFPEEGGQMPDRGFLGEDPVLDVKLKKDPVSFEDTIIHMVRQPLDPGTVVRGRIDWAHRFDQMQQHSGEHIVSGLVNKYYQYNNVGFHLGAEEVTLDFDGTLTLEQLRQIEKEANQAVKENFPVQISFPDAKTLASLPYRSKIDIKGAVRIVEFPGYDICACCAPHVQRTGEIGLIKITGVQTHRGGVRVNILCGDRAIADYTRKQDSVSSISVQLSSKPDLVADAVEKLRTDNAKLKEQICSLQAALMQEKMNALPLPCESRHAVLTAQSLDAIAARNTANQLAEQYEGFGAVLVGNDADGYRYVVASRSLDCKVLAEELRNSFQAKGGGSSEMVQGTIHTTGKEFTKWIINR
ncbi:MAG: alanyl-tRNA editing protein [Lachnospiraceae bacterium]|nr:alanyl-tRNA editing protein [Lachnospiraceae bacterium]